MTLVELLEAEAVARLGGKPKVRGSGFGDAWIYELNFGAAGELESVVLAVRSRLSHFPGEIPVVVPDGGDRIIRAVRCFPPFDSWERVR